MRKHTEQAGCPSLSSVSPSCPLCSPRPEAFGPPQQLWGCCARLQRLGSRGKQLPLLLSTGWKTEEVARLGQSQTCGRALPYFSVDNSYLPVVVTQFLVSFMLGWEGPKNRANLNT